jgi:hypothetical protein
MSEIIIIKKMWNVARGSKKLPTLGLNINCPKHQLSKTSTVQKIYYLIINLLIMQNLLANLTKNVNLKVCWRVVVVKAD